MCFVVYCFHKNSITLFTVTEQVYSLTDIFETDKIRIELLGEIYYKNIKLELHEFAGLYKIYGISLIKNITGMFLIIIFDTNTKELKIFQDITTSYFNLYYTVYGGVFYI
ncbi:hypothetical protein L2915_10405 [Streptococcus pneumoniae]|nr:hypothetical protein [Streptococcus pneumoniae]